MKRIDEGCVYVKGCKVRMVREILLTTKPTGDGVAEYVLYSDGSRVRRCQRRQFLRWVRGAEDVSGSSITIEGDLFHSLD